MAIVTGGARGIGAGIAQSLSAEGARVAVLDLDGVAAEHTAKELAGDAIGIAADAADAARRAVTRISRVDPRPSRRDVSPDTS